MVVGNYSDNCIYNISLEFRSSHQSQLYLVCFTFLCYFRGDVQRIGWTFGCSLFYGLPLAFGDPAWTFSFLR